MQKNDTKGQNDYFKRPESKKWKKKNRTTYKNSSEGETQSKFGPTEANVHKRRSEISPVEYK